MITPSLLIELVLVFIIQDSYLPIESKKLIKTYRKSILSRLFTISLTLHLSYWEPEISKLVVVFELSFVAMTIK